MYDRNIRLWGKENQMKLSNSHVLLINLNSVITELAKNLILSGINIYLYDKLEEGENNKLVDDHDIQNNYFLNSKQIGQERIKVLSQTLAAINQFASLKEIQNFRNIISGSIQCVCIGFISFEKLKIYEDYFAQYNFPVYAINTSGMKAFFYNNFSKTKKLIQESNSNHEYHKEKENHFYYMMEFSIQMDLYMQNLKLANRKKILRNNLFTSICLLEIYTRNNKSVGSVDFENVLTFSQNFLKDNNLEFLSSNEDFLKTFKGLIKNLNQEYNPISSVIGGIVSQEVLKVLTNPSEAFQGIYAYDAEVQSGYFLNPSSF